MNIMGDILAKKCVSQEKNTKLKNVGLAHGFKTIYTCAHGFKTMCKAS